MEAYRLAQRFLDQAHERIPKLKKQKDAYMAELEYVRRPPARTLAIERLLVDIQKVNDELHELEAEIPKLETRIRAFVDHATNNGPNIDRMQRAADERIRQSQNVLKRERKHAQTLEDRLELFKRGHPKPRSAADGALLNLILADIAVNKTELRDATRTIDMAETTLEDLQEERLEDQALLAAYYDRYPERAPPTYTRPRTPPRRSRSRSRDRSLTRTASISRSRSRSRDVAPMADGVHGGMMPAIQNKHIIFDNYHVNNAWGYQFDGTLIIDGIAYPYYLSHDEYYGGKVVLSLDYKIGKINGKPSKQLEASTWARMLELAQQLIDTKPTLTSVGGGFDMGETVTQMYVDGKCVKITCSGDINCVSSAQTLTNELVGLINGHTQVLPVSAKHDRGLLTAASCTRQWMVGLACPSAAAGLPTSGKAALASGGHACALPAGCDANAVLVPVDIDVSLLALHTLTHSGERDYVARVQMHNRPPLGMAVGIGGGVGVNIGGLGLGLGGGIGVGAGVGATVGGGVGIGGVGLGGSIGGGLYAGARKSTRKHKTGYSADAMKTCGGAAGDALCDDFDALDLQSAASQWPTSGHPCVDYRLSVAETQHGQATTSIHLELPVPSTIAPDACMSVTLFATRNAEHNAGPTPSLLEPAVGRYLQIGSVLFPLAKLLHLYASADATAPPTLSGHVYPIGREVCCESVTYDSKEARARIRAHMRAGCEDLRRRVTVLPVSQYGDIDLLESGADKLDAITRALEQEETANRAKIQASSMCPEATRCFMRAIREKNIMLPGFTFTFEPSPLDARNLSEDTIRGLFHMAIVYREIKEQTLTRMYRDGRTLSSVQKLLLEMLETRPFDIACTNLFEVELARLSSIKDQETRYYECVLLVVQAILGVTKYATYVSDEQVCRVCKRHSRADIRTPYENIASCSGDDDNNDETEAAQLVASDAYSDFVGGPNGYRGDCDDLQKFIVETYNLICKWPHGAFSSALLEFVRVAMPHYRCFTAVGTAHAAKAGETQADIEAGGVDETGVRRGIQGHMYAVLLGRTRALVLEATTTYHPEHIYDMDPEPMRVLVQALLASNGGKREVLEMLGINADAVYGFRPRNAAQDFYDCIGTVCGTSLHEIVDTSPQGKGRRVTSAAVTFADPRNGGQQRIGVPMSMLLEPGGMQKYNIQLAHVGFCDEATLTLLESVNVMTTAKLFPPNATTKKKPVSSELTPNEARVRQNINEGPGVMSPLLIGDTDSPYMASTCRTIASAGRASIVFAKRLVAVQTARKSWRLVALKYRADWTTDKWANAMVEKLIKCAPVVSLSAYMDVVFEDLQGVVVVVGVVV